MNQNSQPGAVLRKKTRAAKAPDRGAAHLDCCGETIRRHPDHSYAIPRIRRIQGQLAGIEKMILERRYCPDILVQARAAHSAMRSLESAVLETHVRSCVQRAMRSQDEKEVSGTISELMELFYR